MKYYLAIDIGASSGRHIVGWMDGGTLQTEEVYRFPNGVTEQDGHLVWDMEALFSHVKAGIRAAFAAYPAIESLSVDTWGCDYVLLDGDMEIWPCYAYRDHRTEAIHEEVHAAVSFSELYRRTGSQFQLFNTVYQLAEDKQTGRLDRATDFLMVPEYLMYKLTGVKKKEFTNATTTGLINAKTLEFDREMIQRLGLPERLFPKLSQPGTVLGPLLPEVAEELGGQCRVVLCATHDTASAVEGIPMNQGSWSGSGAHCAPRDTAPYISSGTWSLLGVKTKKPLTDKASEAANWSNEGGVGYNRCQKNIMGMWLVNRLRAELCPDKPWSEIIAEAEASSFDRVVDANDGRFLSPVSMKTAFDQALGLTDERRDPAHFEITNMPPKLLAELRGRALGLSTGDYFGCAYRSLALSYRKALDELERNTGRTYNKLYIVGGGAKNQFLNRLTEEYTGKQVIALPIEATAIGNLKIQIGL
ncbi:MAG: rhamnulokinase [Oscillospiraceae bacterium]|nr:rhamnulokinase [Oscillospiraceae bacterium]